MVSAIQNINLPGITGATGATGATGPQGNTGNTGATGFLGLSYDSGNQNITSAGSLSLAHGLGVVPKIYTFLIKNVTAEFNYAVGDELNIAPMLALPAANSGVGVVANASTIFVRFGSGASIFKIPDKTTGQDQNATNANWKFIVRAYA